MSNDERSRKPSRFRQPTGWARYYLTVVCRHWGLFLPILLVVPLAIAGGLGQGLGIQYLFRDAVNPFDISLSEPGWWWRLPIRLISSAYFETQTYAIALLGLMWTTSLLLEDRFARLNRVYLPNEARIFHYLPGIAVLSLLPLTAALGQLGYDIFWKKTVGWQFLLLPIGGYVGGLIFFFAMSQLAFLSAKYLKRPKIEAVLVLTCLVILIAAFFPLVLPAKLLFVILATVVVAYAALQLLGPTARVGAMAFVLILGIAANTIRPQKYTFPGLEDYYKDDVDRIRPAILAGFKNAKANNYFRDLFRTQEPACAAAPDATLGTGLIDPIANLQHWYSYVTQPPMLPGQTAKPKLVIIATSGGAYRSTYWTARVIETLLAGDRANGDLPGFRKSVRLLTGASGGMVGSAYFAVADPTRPAMIALTIRDDIAASYKGTAVYRNPLSAEWDSLSSVSRQMVLYDMPGFLWPFERRNDRGRELERHWKQLDVTFSALRNDEARGVRPSLVLSPTLADSGVPLIVSNLDLDSLYHDDKEAVQLFQVLAGSQDKLRVRTAVRMSATFPFISPSTRLPTQKGDRVVDAGYYDNFGIDVAVAYLHDAAIMSWLKRCTAGVMVVQVRAWHAGILDPAPSKGWLSRIWRTFEWLTTPIEGVASARASTNYIRNRRELCELQDIYRDPTLSKRPGAACQDDDDFLQTLTFEPADLDADAAFTWNLQPHELIAMEELLKHKQIVDSRADLVKFWKADLKADARSK